MEGFLTAGEAYTHLKNNLRNFIYPVRPLEEPKAEALRDTPVESSLITLSVFDDVHPQITQARSTGDGDSATVPSSTHSIEYSIGEKRGFSWYMQAWNGYTSSLANEMGLRNLHRISQFWDREPAPTKNSRVKWRYVSCP